MKEIAVFVGDALKRYHFGEDHPFGPKRHDAFFDELKRQKLDQQVDLLPPESCNEADVLLFHAQEHLERVKECSNSGEGELDRGDTPAVEGIFHAACCVVGSVLKAGELMMAGQMNKAFIPIAGLHHASRESAAGFCVFNDCGVLIEVLRERHGIRRVAYIDIDAHHGDGVFYAFEDDPDLCFVDIHEDGNFLYPGTGSADETGKSKAAGTKLNVPLPPGADDDTFFEVWPKIEAFIQEARPEFIIMQCGADSLAGDPITHMKFSSRVHAHAAARLAWLADEFADGRLLAAGGGGYNLDNLADAWCAVVDSMVKYKDK